MESNKTELLRAVTRAYARLQRREASCCGLSETGCEVLCAIGEEGSIPQARLAAKLGLEKSWVSRAVDGLERGGLVERRKCCADARAYDVAFTASGRARYEALNAGLEAQAAELMSRIPEAERPAVTHALELLAAALADSASFPDCGCGEGEGEE
jgi:DNA-binding MarR family transcriptional regulator